MDNFNLEAKFGDFNHCMISSTKNQTTLFREIGNLKKLANCRIVPTSEFRVKIGLDKFKIILQKILFFYDDLWCFKYQDLISTNDLHMYLDFRFLPVLLFQITFRTYHQGNVWLFWNNFERSSWNANKVLHSKYCAHIFVYYSYIT